MKVFSVIILILILTLSYSYAQNRQPCPKTLVANDCFSCHTIPSFKVKEAPPDETYVYPVRGMRIAGGVGYFLIREISDDDMKSFLDYLDRKNIKKAVIEIHSPGGSLFAATRAINLMSEWESRGNIIETRVNGFALSGGFLIFIAGTKGHRFVSRHADLMWHEIQSLEMVMRITTPADKEEEARVLRHLQDVRNAWIATRGKLTKQEIDEKIKKKEFWMSGEEAVRFGFADGFIE